jgi:hypothetical protein
VSGNLLRYAGDPIERDNLLAPQPTWADATDYNAPVVGQHLADAWQAVQQPQTWVDAAHQYSNALLMGTTAPGIRAFHGSPADFERFDSRFINTGEKAQAFGHGLYFAENEGVAKGYRDRLSGANGIIPGAATGKASYAVNGEYPPEGIAGHRAMDTAIDLNGLLSYMHMHENKPSLSVFWKQGDPIDPRYDARGSYQSSMDYLRGQIERRIDYHRAELGPDGPRGMAEQDMDALANYYDKHVRDATPADVTARPPGKMYEVNINADPEHMLDWDKPLTEQSQYVRDAVDKVKQRLPADYWFNHERVPGSMLLGNLRAAARDGVIPNAGGNVDAAAAAALHEAGIPGIRYLDAGSRTQDTGTSNHVIFDANTIEILRKYGIAGLMAGGGAAAAAGQGQQ